MNPTMMHRPHPDADHPAPGGRSPFDQFRHVRPDGSEFWDARDLMPLLGYSKWGNFAEAVDQARGVIAAERGEAAAAAEVAATGKISRNTRGQNRTVPTVELSRHAAYLTAMRGDSRKPEIRAALLYFAARTREAEVMSATPPLLDPTTPEGHLALALQYVRVAEQLVHSDRRVQELEPKAAVHDRFLSAQGGNRLVRQAAKELNLRETDLRGFLLAERLIYQRQRPCGGVEYDFYAEHAERFATTETLVRHNRRAGECAHYTLSVTPAGLVYIQKRLDRRRTVGRGWYPG